MIKQFQFSTKAGIALLLCLHCIPSVAPAKPIEASSTMTVINVTKWNQPSTENYRVLDDVLLDVNVDYDGHGTISWSWDPPWPPAYPGYSPNQLSARIWNFECHLDGGKACEATAWDWVLDLTVTKQLKGGKFRGEWLGTMFSTICGSDAPPPEPYLDNCMIQSRERSNIMMIKNPR